MKQAKRAGFDIADYPAAHNCAAVTGISSQQCHFICPTQQFIHFRLFIFTQNDTTHPAQQSHQKGSASFLNSALRNLNLEMLAREERSLYLIAILFEVTFRSSLSVIADVSHSSRLRFVEIIFCNLVLLSECLNPSLTFSQALISSFSVQRFATLSLHSPLHSYGGLNINRQSHHES